MSRVPDEARGYSVPDTSDTPRRWADGPHKGKLVSSTPVKVRALKLDPVESEARALANRLAKLGSLGKLEIEADHARKVANLKEAAYEVAYCQQQNPWVKQEIVPPSRWPMVLLVTVQAVLVALLAAALWQNYRPTPSSSVGAHTPPVLQEAAPEAQQGRVARRKP